MLIGFLNGRDAHHRDATTALVDLAERGETLVVSAVTLAEIFVAPQRHGPLALARAKRKIYGLPRMTIVPLDHRLAESTAAVRASSKQLKTPDAAVVATARTVGASRILTTDNQFNRVDEAITLRQFNRGG